MVELVASLAARASVGVLSNCHSREVRHWPDSPFADHVTVVARSCEIGFMKPDVRCYMWLLDRLRVEPSDATYVGNGSSDELLGARVARFGTIVHCNIVDATNGLVSLDEQQRRADQADLSVTMIDELAETLQTAV